jgi:hypothetical protein
MVGSTPCPVEQRHAGSHASLHDSWRIALIGAIPADVARCFPGTFGRISAGAMMRSVCWVVMIENAEGAGHSLRAPKSGSRG